MMEETPSTSRFRKGRAVRETLCSVKGGARWACPRAGRETTPQDASPQPLRLRALRRAQRDKEGRRRRRTVMVSVRARRSWRSETTCPTSYAQHPGVFTCDRCQSELIELIESTQMQQGNSRPPASPCASPSARSPSDAPPRSPATCRKLSDFPHHSIICDISPRVRSAS